MDFAIGSFLSSNVPANHLAALLIAARKKTAQMLPQYIKSALTPQERTPPTLLYRVSVSIYNDPLQVGTWVVIAIRVKVFVFNAIFGGPVIREIFCVIICLCLLNKITNLKSMETQITEFKTANTNLNQELATLKENTANQLKAFEEANTNLNAKVGTLETRNTDLQATNTDLQATKDGFEEQLAELKSATTSLLSSISQIAEDREATVDDIASFKAVADIFIKVVQGHQNVWGDVSLQLQEAQSKLLETSVRLDERNRQVEDVTQRLTLAQGMLATTTHQLGMAADRVDVATHRVDEMSQPQQFEQLVSNILTKLLAPNRHNRSQQHSPQGERSRESIIPLVEG